MHLYISEVKTLPAGKKNPKPTNHEDTPLERSYKCKQNLAPRYISWANLNDLQAKFHLETCKLQVSLRK